MSHHKDDKKKSMKKDEYKSAKKRDDKKKPDEPINTRIKIQFGDVDFKYEGATEFTMDDILDLVTALYQGSVWEEGWEQYDLDDAELDALESDADDEDDDSDEDAEDDDEAELAGEPTEEVDAPAVAEGPVDGEVVAETDAAFSPLQCDPAELNDACSVMVAERLGADSHASTVLAIAARLELIDGLSPFTRDNLRDALIAAEELASDSYVHNLSRAMGDLMEDGMLIEQRADYYRLSADTRRDLEAKLA